MAEKETKINKKENKKIEVKENSASKTSTKKKEKENQSKTNSSKIPTQKKITRTPTVSAVNKKTKVATSKKNTTAPKKSTTTKKSETSKKTSPNKKETISAIKKDYKKVEPKKNSTKTKEKETPKKKKTKNSKVSTKEKRNSFKEIFKKLKKKRNKKEEKIEKQTKKKNSAIKKEQNKKIPKETKKETTKKKEKHTRKNKKEIAKKIGNTLSSGIKKVDRFFGKLGNKTKNTSKKIIGSIKKGASHLKIKSSKKKVEKKKTSKKDLKKAKEKSQKEKSQKEQNKKTLEILPEEKILKKKRKRRKRIRRLIFLAILCIVIALLLMVPYGITTHYSSASGRVLDVPKFMILKEECCSYNATFITFRSAWSLQKDLDEMISDYEKLDCDGKTYYYNSKENYTITEYGINKGIFLNEVYISYGHGNSCDIDTKFKKLELLAERFTISDAIRDGNYVMDGDKIYNEEAYDKFMANVKKKKPSTLRIVTTNTDGDVLITDLEYLKGGKYRVSYDGTRDRNSKNHESIIAYKFDHLKESKNKLYAYNGDKLKTKKAKKYETYYLLTLPKK